MSETKRVDPTVTGLFLIGFITLLIGIAGILNGSEADTAGTVTWSALTFLGGGWAAGAIVSLGFVFLVLAYMAGKCGNAFAVALFAFVAIVFVATPELMAGGDGINLVFIFIAVFFFIFALVALLIGAPKMLVILLAFVALLFVFFGMFLQADNPDNAKTMAYLFGVFGILSFLVATYLAVALSTEKLPVM